MKICTFVVKIGNNLQVKPGKANKVNVITLGCSKNWVDSENMITQLVGNDYEVTHEQARPDTNIVIINTCGFIDRAKEESVNTILEYAQLRKNGNLEKLYVTGCLSQRYKEDLERDIPEVDAYFGTLELPSLLNHLNADYKHELIGERVLTTPSHYAYVKISEGCNRTCAFCAIPLMRGKHISKPIETLEKEVKHLAAQGVKEIILIAQELTYYGLDIYQKRRLPELLRKLSKIDGIEWIRLHYAYPSKFPLEIVNVIKEEPKICNYLDIPLQHINDEVLKTMRRQISSQESRDLISKIRDIHPDIHLRTTMLVGFPGESDAHFIELCDFVEEFKFDRMGVFQYSHEESTIAYKLHDNVTPEIKELRANQLMEIQRDISLEHNQAMVGKTIKVLFDRKEGAYFVGRSEADSPEVDNEIQVAAQDQYIRIGDFANINITEASDYDLTGVLSS